jgi:hypothetical protein
MKQSFSILKAAFKKTLKVQSPATTQPVEYESDAMIALHGTSPAYMLASCSTLWKSAFAVRRL